jgi:hypothetical protein
MGSFSIKQEFDCQSTGCLLSPKRNHQPPARRRSVGGWWLFSAIIQALPEPSVCKSGALTTVYAFLYKFAFALAQMKGKRKSCYCCTMEPT